MIDLSAPATAQIEALADGTITSAGLLEAYVAHYENVNGPLNAVIRTDLETARATACDIDERRSKGAGIGPLQGLPMTVKDCLDVDGLPAVCGLPALVNREPAVADATVVARLKEAGAVIWGKTNTPMMAGDVQTYNKPFGVTNHPLDEGRSPGGSSGGSAAALAAHMTALEVGSDIGGSLRNPAHYSGVCGFKPTYGLLPTTGHVPPKPDTNAPFPPDLAVVGPMARNVKDLRLLMEVLSEGRVPVSQNKRKIENLNIGVWSKEDGFPLSAACSDALLYARHVLESAGARTADARPDIDMQRLLDTYLDLLCPIMLSEMPGVAKGIFRVLRPLLSLLNRGRRYSFLNVLIKGVARESEIDLARQVRSEMKQACAEFFRTRDILICLVTATPALPHNNKGLPHGRKIDVDGETVPYFHQVDWIALATACHLPAAVIPVSRTANGLPVGVQLIGPEGADADVLEIANLFETAFQASKP